MSELLVISADSHAEEPADLYDGLPEHLKSRAPRIENISGKDYYVVDGIGPRNPMEAPLPMNEDDKRKEFRGGEEVSGGFHQAGGADIPQRLADIEEDGVTGEVIYPNGILRVFASPSAEYQSAVAKLYNNWYADTFHKHSDRFVPSAVIQTSDVDEAVQEVKRVADMGFRSISLPVSRPALPYTEKAYGPLWQTIEDSGIPMSFHVFTASESREVDKPYEEIVDKEQRGEDLTGMVLGMAEAMSPLSMLTASAALQEHPDLKFVLVECGAGWLAWALYAMDDVFKRRHMWQLPRLEMKPSEFFRRQGYLTFGDDPIGLHNIEFTGVDCMMWGSDYPHDEGTFPHSQEVIQETFEGISEEDKRKIVGENAARLYGFPLN